MLIGQYAESPLVLLSPMTIFVYHVRLRTCLTCKSASPALHVTASMEVANTTAAAAEGPHVPKPADIAAEQDELASSELADLISPERPKRQQARRISVGPSDFELLCCLGTGAFGRVRPPSLPPRLAASVPTPLGNAQVFQVKHRRTGEVFAMKVINKELLHRTNQVGYMKSERDIMTKVRCCCCLLTQNTCALMLMLLRTARRCNTHSSLGSSLHSSPLPRCAVACVCALGCKH